METCRAGLERRLNADSLVAFGLFGVAAVTATTVVRRIEEAKRLVRWR